MVNDAQDIVPERKHNRLKGYDYSQSGLYFITICVTGRKNLLGNVVGDDDHIVPIVRLSDYGIVTEKYVRGINGIDKYVIMPNHIHMVIRIESNIEGTMWSSSPTQKSVSQTIKSFITLITKEIGFPLWQRSFHDRIIRDEQEYLKIWNYIDTNPARWESDCFYSE